MFNWVKTAMLMAAITALFGVVGAAIGGGSGMLMALGFALLSPASAAAACGATTIPFSPTTVPLTSASPAIRLLLRRIVSRPKARIGAASRGGSAARR